MTPRTREITYAKARADRALRAVRDEASSVSAFRWSVDQAVQRLASRAEEARAALDAYADMTGCMTAQNAVADLCINADSATPNAVAAILALPDDLPDEPASCPLRDAKLDRAISLVARRILAEEPTE